MDKAPMTFRLEPEERQQVEELATRSGMSVSALVRLALRRLLRNPGVLGK